MKTALFSNLQSIVGCFSKSTPDDEVTSELINLCNAHGDDVTVARQVHITGPDDGKRHFLVLFKSITAAVYFARSTDRVTDGSDGVTIKVD
jgi:hypothetical protein